MTHPEETRLHSYETVENSGLPMLPLAPGRETSQADAWRAEPPASHHEMRMHLKTHSGNVGVRTGSVYGSELTCVALVAGKGAELPDLPTWRITGPKEILLFACPDFCPTSIKLEEGLFFVGSNGYVPGPGSRVGEKVYRWERGPLSPGVSLMELPEELLEQIRREEYAKTGVRSDVEGVVPGSDTDTGDGRVDVILSDNVMTAVDTASELLARGYPPESKNALFSQAGELVLIRGEGEAFSCKTLAGPVCKELLSGVARWKLREGKNILPPNEVISALLRRGSWEGVAPLDLVLHAPMMLLDGKVCLDRGYKPAQRTYCNFDPEPYACHRLPVSGMSGAQKSAKMLLEPFKDFPFRNPHDKASLLALILTMVGRETIEGEVPVFGIRSPVRGTGKTLLGRAACMVASGVDPALQPKLDKVEEVRKNLFASALAGDRVIFFDNEEGQFGSTVLSSCVTSGYIEDRILGKSEKRRVPWRAVVMVSGNNLTFRKDQARRTVPIDLDAMLEKPEARDLHQFAFCPLLPHVKVHQQQLFMLAVHILESYAAAGRPRMIIQGLGGFESWDANIRQAVVWAFEEDPLHHRFRREAEETDTEAQTIIEFILDWERLIGVDTMVRCSELVKTTNDEIRQLLVNICYPRPMTPQALGIRLYQIHDRPLSGKVFRKHRKRGIGYWVLLKVGVDPIALRQREVEASVHFLELKEEEALEDERRAQEEGFFDDAAEA